MEKESNAAPVIGNESNQISFLAGIIVAFLVMGVVILVAVMVMRYRSRKQTKIIIRDMEA